MLNIEEIKKREQAATPGPWEAELSEGDCGKFSGCPKNLEYCNDDCPKCKYWEISKGACPIGPESVECGDYCFFTDADAEFMCHARTDIPTLIAEVENSHCEIATLKKALELASRSLAEETSTTGEEESIANNADYNYGYFLMQAQEDTHET